jgi:hypothetical protein
VHLGLEGRAAIGQQDVWMLRRCASRTVLATPPLVTMPPTISVSMSSARRMYSSRVW